ncbi:HNH endonuclease family protein [Argonema antarcticum]|uniref:HNH endonuclease family protein n=1 Tax=Argonema antarcticum TaxID=2942763 RepID=UPI002012188E|nr:HNH endonuclease family protein [Argonema antarcticum]MCL1474007.1 HNH endonuclease family protein [Argonema antarcticum A004/B2]
MKTTSEWWWGYWNNEKLKESLQGGIHHLVAKYLLWKYEIHLEQQGQNGYSHTRFDRIISPELEHIAPTTEPEIKPDGYDDYDNEFRNQYLNCLGNYLLLSKSHNCAVGNIPFAEKLATYTHNEQQREIQSLVRENGVWSKEIIQHRKDKIIGFIMDNC